MANFLLRLLSRLFRKQIQSRRTRKERARKLLLENVEPRCLMAADFATIGGNIYTDLTDNGKTADDTAITSGVTVRLFRDGGNGNFESTSGAATGDDVLVTSQTANATGDYLFEDLAAGRYFVQQAAVTGKIQRTAERVKTVDITTPNASGTGVTSIDTFTDNTTLLTANSTTPTVSSVTTTSGSNTIGNERDIVLNYTSGANNIDVQVSGGLLSLNPGATTSGSVILTYDGADADATTVNHSNLNVNLTSSGATAFQFLAGSEAGNTITVDLFSGSGNTSSLTTALPVTAGAVPTEVMILRFDDFTTSAGTGANFSAITAMRIQINAAASSDAQLDLTQTVAPFLSTQNFANLNPMSIGDRVWRDNDNDGTVDTGEPAIQGAIVELYSDTDSSGGFNTGDTLIGSDTTDASGNYLFEDLFPGSYVAVFPSANFTTGGALEGFTSSANADTPNNDVNNRSKALDGTGIAVSNGVLTLVAGGEPTNDGDTNTNSNLSFDFGFTPEIDLEVTSVASAATYNAGQNVTYTLTVTNNGPAQADSVSVTNDIPNFLTATAQNITATGGTVQVTSNSTGEIVVSYPNIPSGESRTITVVATSLASQAATTGADATVTVTGTGLDSDVTNNTDTASFDLLRQAVLQITKTDTPDPILVGQALSYQILVTNVGPSTATNVQVRDTLPTGLTFNTVSSTVGTATHNAGLISLDLPSLAVGSSATINVGTTVQSNFGGSTIANSATADADEAALVTGTSSTTVNPQVDLAVTTTDSADPASRGGQLTYTLAVVNNGPSGATNVTLVNTLPTGVTFVSANGPTGTTVTPPPTGSNDVTIGIGSLAAAGTATVTIIGTVGQTAAASLTNSVLVRSTESTGGFDVNATNNTDTETTATVKTIDLELTKTDNGTTQNPIRPGAAITYTLTARNNGPTDATGVRVVDNIPDGLQITSATIGSTSVTVPTSAGDTTAANPDDITFDIGNLASGATSVITVIGNVLSATRGDVVNSAVISTTDATFTESNSANNTATRTTSLSASVDLAITNTSTTNSATAGGSLVYQIDVTNNGPSTATGVTLSDTLPSGVTFTSATAAQGTVSHASGVVTGNLGTIAPGATVRVTVNATVNPNSRGTLSNTATVTSTETDSSSANNSSTATTTLGSSVDLAITSTKTNPNDPAVAGGTLTYTLVVTNAGPSTANSVTVADTLPNGLSFTSGSVAGQTNQVTAVGQQVSVNLGTLAPNESRTITIQTSVASSTAGTLSNTATVSATETDSSTANNTTTLATPVAVVGSITGRTYVDANRNGIADSTEAGLSGITVTLSGSDILGRAVSQTTTTDSSGNYTFSNLQPGTYTVTQTQPQGFRSGSSNPGSAGGTAGDNTITAIALTSGTNATANNFGETPNPLSLRRFLASSTQFD